MTSEQQLRISIGEMLTDDTIREIGADTQDINLCLVRICGHVRNLENALKKCAESAASICDRRTEGIARAALPKTPPQNVLKDHLLETIEAERHQG